MKSRTFVDNVIVHAKAGDGGHGCVSFRREKYVPRGGPDGGDGARGGHVILVGNPNENSLVRLHYSPHLRARNGEHGRGQKQHGRNGEDCVVPIPCGTEVVNVATGELIADIVQPDQPVVVARGGRGGIGNCHFVTSTHQAPTERTEGKPGEAFELRLTLKLLADVGLVGFPNAGKSSLLSVISDAHPKIAPYPFTTLNPVIGTLIDEDLTRMTVADIPGLLKGAHEGVGLGHDFLRHIERAACLVYVVDMGGMDGRNPVDDFRTLKDELRCHRKDLARRPFLIAANKMDLPEAAANLKLFRRKTRTKPLPLSAVTREGVPEFRAALLDLWRRNAAQTAVTSAGA